MRKRLTIAMIGALFFATPASGQTTSTTARTAPANSSFSKLSPGNQKIALALYDAQVAPAPTRLTLDQIAAKKQGGQGWGNVFKQMKAQGLVDARSLGQVISASHHGLTTSPTSPPTTSYHSTGPVVTNAAGSTSVAGNSDHGKSSAQGPDGTVAKGGQGHGSDSTLASVSNGSGGGRGAGVTNRGGGKDK